MNTKKSIKAINLEPKSNQNCPVYKGSACNWAEAAYHSGDYKTGVFWMSGFYDLQIIGQRNITCMSAAYMPIWCITIWSNPRRHWLFLGRLYRTCERTIQS
jgi:hypothetical protein